MKKLFAFALSLALVLVSFTALAEDFNPADYPVAIAQGVMNHPVHRIVQLGFLKAAQELGYTNARVIGTEGTDPAEVYSACDDFAAEGGKGLMLWAGDDSAFPTLNRMAAEGVVVGIAHFKFVKEDGSLPDGLSFNMACDPVLYGKQSAEIMAKTLDGKEGSLAITLNTKNITENAADDSFRAEWEALGATYNLAGIKVLDTEMEGGVMDEATAVNLAIIQANPDIIGAFGTTGNSPITWSEAATRAGKADGEIAIIGMDATEGNLDALESGKVLALVAQPLYQEAYQIMEYLDKVLRGEEVPLWTDLEAPIVTKDGEGPNGLQFHRDIAAQVETFFK
ncbi:MAG: sugar ABC transporter substrate-binding protein [Clostridia bacterium]|nr:sugar ABC transporter substrate-binding protein [Clostridia bacterium]